MALIAACALCGGDLTVMGVLGASLWCRCRACGMDVRAPVGALAGDEWGEE